MPRVTIAELQAKLIQYINQNTVQEKRITQLMQQVKDLESKPDLEVMELQNKLDCARSYEATAKEKIRALEAKNNQLAAICSELRGIVTEFVDASTRKS